MNVSLPKEQLEWLEAQAAAGHFASIDEALAIAVADLALSEDDLPGPSHTRRGAGLDRTRRCALG
jgi:Arc/MetJ-type ribon-helix-helix transcriptional regulator